MKCAVFQRLPSRRQRQLVLDKGVPLGKRESRNFCIFLFAIDSFYVEVYFFKESGDYCTLKPFEEVAKLEPYLEQINVDDLLVA